MEENDIGRHEGTQGTPGADVDIGQMFGAPNVDTFAGLSGCESVEDVGDASVVIVGVPHATPYGSVGSYCAGAPAAIRAAIAPFAANISHVNFDFGAPVLAPGSSAIDLGDLDVDEHAPEANRALIRSTIEHVLDQGAVPVVIGGDDSVPIPVFEAFAGRDNFCVVQIDAHIDWRDEVDGERMGLSSNMRRSSEMDHIRSIVQIGQRAIGSGRDKDLADAQNWGVDFISGREFAAIGVQAVLDRLPADMPVLFNLDIDGMDPSIVPGVIGRAPGGLGYWDVVELIHGTAERGGLAAFNLVEFMPARDVSSLGANVAAHLVLNALHAITHQNR